jgi:hypothetical protein
MKVNEVPQDKVDKAFKRGDTTYVHYALDDNGKMVQVWSKGWDVLATSLETLGNMFSELAEDAKERIKKGETSPLEYFMNHYQLDIPLFAAQMGVSKRKIKKHFDAKAFDKLDEKTLQEYADFFNIDINEIKNFKKGLK